MDTPNFFANQKGMHWHFYHNPEWDLDNAVLLAQLFADDRRLDTPLVFWRNILWEGGQIPAVWLEEHVDYLVTRSDAFRISPNAFDINSWSKTSVWDEEHIEEIIAGSYPPPIPNRFEGNLEFIELSERYRRGYEMFWSYQDAVSADSALSRSISLSIRWLAKFENDELADFYFYTMGIYDAERPRFRKDSVDFREKVHQTLISALTIYLSSNRTD